MVRVSVMLRNEFGTDQTLPWWCCMMYKNLPVLRRQWWSEWFWLNHQLHLQKWNLKPTVNHHHASVFMLYSPAISICFAPNAVFLHPHPVFSQVSESLGFVSTSKFFGFFLVTTPLWRTLLTRLLRSIHRWTRLPVVSSSFGPIVLLPLLFCRWVWTTLLETPICHETPAWEKPCWCKMASLGLVAMPTLSVVQDSKAKLLHLLQTQRFFCMFVPYPVLFPQSQFNLHIMSLIISAWCRR